MFIFVRVVSLNIEVVLGPKSLHVLVFLRYMCVHVKK